MLSECDAYTESVFVPRFEGGLLEAVYFEFSESFVRHDVISELLAGFTFRPEVPFAAFRFVDSKADFARGDGLFVEEQN